MSRCISSQIIALVVLASTADGQPKATLRTFQGPGYTFLYPSDWEPYQTGDIGMLTRGDDKVALFWFTPKSWVHYEAHSEFIQELHMRGVLPWVWRDDGTRDRVLPDANGGGHQTELVPADAELLRQGDRFFVTTYMQGERLLGVVYCMHRGEKEVAGEQIIRTLVLHGAALTAVGRWDASGDTLDIRADNTISRELLGVPLSIGRYKDNGKVLTITWTNGGTVEKWPYHISGETLIFNDHRTYMRNALSMKGAAAVSTQ